VKRVLIVEDNVSYAQLISDFLTLNGLTCQIVHSGNEAIEFLKSSKAHLIISDVRMPNGSGIDLIRWNANQPVTIPLISISGDVLSHEETEQFCEVMGIPHLSKPFTMEVLLAMVESFSFQSV
jgi:DNA-binding response OmpR family regulator